MAGQRDGRASIPLARAGPWLSVHRLMEDHLFGLLGRWSASEPDARAKLLLARHSHHHAWHAELWTQRAPGLLVPLPGAGPAQLEEEAATRLSGVLEALDAVGGRGTVERLAGVYRVVVPRLLGSYEERLEGASEVADGPTVRALRLLVFDELSGWREGERALQALVTGPEDAERAAGAQALVESAVVAAGGLVGAIT